jgi:hypothetical protein
LRPNKNDCLLFIFSGILISLIFVPIPNVGKVGLGFVVASIGILFTTFLSRIDKTSKVDKDKEKIKALEEKDKSIGEKGFSQMQEYQAKVAEANRVILVFGVIYSAIAALGLQVAFDFYYPDMHNAISQNIFALPDISHSFLILSYLSVAVLFYHGGIIFLSTAAAQELTEGRARRVFPDFIGLFLQAVIIYYMAKDMSSPEVFIKLVMTLMVVHIIWVIYFFSVAKERSVYFEWVHFDSLTFLALLLVSLFGYGIQSYWVVFVLLALRTICDYGFAWKEFYTVYSV